MGLGRRFNARHFKPRDPRFPKPTDSSMSRYTGPRVKIARRFDQYLPGLSRKSAKTRTAPPGQHGMNRRRKASEYRLDTQLPPHNKGRHARRYPPAIYP